MDRAKLRHYAAKVKLENTGLNRRIVARLAGVTFDGRQDVIAKVEKNTDLRLIRDRRNEYDFYAVGVWAFLPLYKEFTDELEGFHQVGYVPQKMSKLISHSLDKGIDLKCSVHRKTGGMVSEYSGERLSFGLEVNIVPAGVTE